MILSPHAMPLFVFTFNINVPPLFVTKHSTVYKSPTLQQEQSQAKAKATDNSESCLMSISVHQGGGTIATV